MARIQSGRFRTKIEAKQFLEKLKNRYNVFNPRLIQHNLGGYAVSYRLLSDKFIYNNLPSYQDVCDEANR